VKQNSALPVPRRLRVMIAIATLLAMASGDPGVASPPAARHSVSYPVRTMGTYAHIILVTADSASGAPVAASALASFARVDSLMSNWTTTSEVARINREAGAGTTVIHPEVARVVQASLDVGRETGGAFDITVEPLVRLWGFLGGRKRVPSDEEVRATLLHVGADKLEFNAARRTLRFADPAVRIDLGGIAKGYAVDVVAESLAASGVRDALVDLSGNMMALGTPADADHWRIGIRDPRDRMGYFARLALRPGESISTSGKYEQFVAQDGKTYGHILDPKTGRSADGLISVTVVAHSAFDSDAWDTPLFVLGPERARRIASENDLIRVVLVEPGTAGVDTVWVESALRDRFVLEPAASALFVVKYF
jgi:thiamine biosynthesis lipoprotein